MQTPHSPARSFLALGLAAAITASVGAQFTTGQGGPAASGHANLPVAGLVLPNKSENREGAGLAFWAISPFDARRQVVISARLIANLVDKDLVAIRVRRNYSTDHYEGGNIDMEVSMSHGVTNPWNLSPSFAGNRGLDHTQVFDGSVFVPYAPAPIESPPAWEYPNTVTINFQRPFRYTGGPLCIETVTKNTDANTPWWPIDAEVSTAEGEIIPFGVNCYTGSKDPAGAEPGSFTVGSSGIFYLRGGPNPAPAMCMVGASNTSYQGSPLPLDLSYLGMPGCKLYTSSSLLLSTMTTPMEVGRPLGHASVKVDIPVDGRLHGVTIYSQWLVGDPGANVWGMSFTNAVQAKIGASRVRNIGWVEAVDINATTGRLLTGRVPVLRLDSQ